jgi:uncharacterized protein
MRTYSITEKEKIEEIIKACRTCFLGLSDTNGQPYVLPMNFGYHENVIYLHSGQFGRKWDIIKANPKVCITFCLGDELAYQDEHIACSWRVKSKSVIAEGLIEIIDDYDQKLEILNILMAQYSSNEFQFNPPAVRNVGVMKIAIDRIEAKEFGAKTITPWNS